MLTRLFDLNIEEILDNWEVYHAIREVIANALDEQVLTNTAPIRIYKDFWGNWHIKDFGRGIKIEHFTLNENLEKVNSSEGIIGKFGVGLKDALATFGRNNKGVIIQSRFGQFRLKEAAKHGFDNIVTFHIEYKDAPQPIQGTEFILSNVKDIEIAEAKSLFLAFSEEEVLETTTYGDIIRKKSDTAKVYINGVLASDEANFLFSYNITNLTESMRKRLNRERVNVGRTTYADRIKSILRAAKSKTVQDMLADQVSKRASGTQCDELLWLEVSQLAFNYLNQRSQVAFVTEQDIYHRPEVIDNLKRDGITPVVVTDVHKEKIDQQIETGGVKLRTVETYVRDFNESFQFKFIDPRILSHMERKVYDLTPRLFTLMGLRQESFLQVKISETMRLTIDGTSGVWDPQLKAIVILRSQLSRPEAFAGTLLHEAIHAVTRMPDVNREFESALTESLGKVAINGLRMAGVPI